MKAMVVVEDDPSMQMLIQVTLAIDDRIEVGGCAQTADEAVVLAKEQQPDIVILDHFIDGDIMGLEAAPLIKEVAPDSVILLFTSHDLSTEATRSGAVDAFLSKRDLAFLLPTVQRLLGLQHVTA
jgi:DNA-binding NarL/FixJ family response regulator